MHAEDRTRGGQEPQAKRRAHHETLPVAPAQLRLVGGMQTLPLEHGRHRREDETKACERSVRVQQRCIS